ncbi:hypothetical protein [Clostridium sp. UBA4548]|uniref:hypothetical protein n=1 Tax=Clostridium sp. UBA4548 TaxID=1946361 RepID=UPI0025C58995|nr:hypothetical protein [Clostridium sp. UBA4548]
MSGIWKINMVQNQSTKQDLNKLTFKKGDSFVARVLKLDGNTSEVILRLLDGRTFPAKIEGAMNGPLDNYLLKFAVDSFQDGKLNIKILEGRPEHQELIKEQNEDNVLNDLIGRIKFSFQKEDIRIIKAMIKFDIPISEENFKEIKAFSDFISKIKSSPEEENLFIEKYLNSKGVQSDSLKGQTIKETLKGFFNEAKKLDLNSILTFKESKIPLTEDNLRGFNKIISPSMNIFKDLEEIKTLVGQTGNHNGKNSFIANINGEITNNNSSTNKAGLENKAVGREDNSLGLNNKETSEVKESKVAKIDASKISSPDSDSAEPLKNTSLNHKDIEVSKHSVSDKTQEEQLSPLKLKGKAIEEKTFLSTEGMVKEEIKGKLGMLKNNLLELLKFTEENNNTVNKVFQNLEGKFQEFKMFNTLNNDYYYLNIPMNVKENQYDCKLVIKDERTSGKKLDSKNIKIATSISTINMNTVDAYISVINNSVTIRIEADKTFVKALDVYKEKLLMDLGDENHVFNVSVNQRKVEFSLSNCREFFSDEDITAINIVV